MDPPTHTITTEHGVILAPPEPAHYGDRVYLEPVTKKDGTCEPRFATVKYLGGRSRPYELHFVDGSVERTTARIVLEGLLPPGAVIPSPEASTMIVRNARAALPAPLDYSTQAAARGVLTLLLPGSWPAGHSMALFDFAAHAQQYPPIVPPLSAIVSLAKALPGQHLITTMFTMPDVLEGFRQVYPMARTNATPSGSRDLLQMAPYKVCVDQGCSLIVATPAEPARDIVIALAHRAGVHSIA